MYTQTNAGLLCCVGSGSTVAVPYGRAYTCRQNRCWCRRRYRCCHQYNPGLVYTHTDKIAICTCKAVSFVSDAEQSTWLPCGTGGFICCVCLLQKKILNNNVASQEECCIKDNFKHMVPCITIRCQ